jgi:hypothetical protein
MAEKEEQVKKAVREFLYIYAIQHEIWAWKYVHPYLTPFRPRKPHIGPRKQRDVFSVRPGVKKLPVAILVEGRQELEREGDVRRRAVSVTPG